jgi:hypothetical protein
MKLQEPAFNPVLREKKSGDSCYQLCCSFTAQTELNVLT